MGFRICYLASKAAPERIAEALELILNEPSHEMPHGEWWIAKHKKSGWTILWSENEEFGQQSLQKIEGFSNDFGTYICEVNEMAMWSSSEYWSKGQQVWRVTHAGDGDDVFNLSESGTPPKGLVELKKRLIARQHADGDDVDHIFEVPLDLAALDIGFRHDEELQSSEVEAFYSIQAPKKKSLLSRILGSW